jgi:dipeptidyl aminopeptidase/acylaminoacyl peptidase
MQIGGQVGFATGAVSVSETGAIAYQAGLEVAPSRLAWFDRAGKQIGLLGDPGDYVDVGLSPDGTRAALSVVDSARRTRDIWIYDVARGLRQRFTFDPAGEQSPIWSPDGGRVVFVSNRKGPGDLYERPSKGGTDEEPLFADSVAKTPLSWSPDGQRILYAAAGKETGRDLWVLPLMGDNKPAPFRHTRFNEVSGQFSPDGRWIAYVSDESGRQEVYVAPFAGTGGSSQISTAGGVEPRWRRDGAELFYWAGNTLMAASVNGRGSAFEVGAVRPLFESRRREGGSSSYDVSVDGQRFLVNSVVDESAPVTLLVNWPALLKKP